MGKITVKIRFQDKFNRAKIYQPGDVLDFADEARIADLVKRGLVETEKTVNEPQVFGSIDLSKAAKDIIAAIEAEPEVNNLTLSQEAENAGKARKSVIAAIEARIADLSE